MYTKQLADNRRVCVEYDEFTSNPLPDMGEEVLRFRSDWYDRDTDKLETANCPVIRAFGHFRERWDDDTALTLANRWSRIFHDGTRAITQTVHLDQSSWRDVISSGECAKANIEEWAQWARGDVYHVFTEVWDPTPGEGWTYEDGLGGIYADSAEEAAEYYEKECLDV